MSRSISIRTEANTQAQTIVSNGRSKARYGASSSGGEETFEKTMVGWLQIGMKHIWYKTSQDEVVVGNGIEVVNQFVTPVEIGSLCKAHIQISLRNLLT